MVDADSTTVAMGSAHVQGLSRPQRRRLLLAAGVLAVLLLWPWLSLLTSAAYCYTWWALAPEIHWAPTPGEPAAAVDGDAAGGGGGGGGGVPKVIHQTWKDADIPQKWQKARQSCIDLHPDYEYKLWTDADGLQFITVRPPGLAAVAGGAFQHPAAALKRCSAYRQRLHTKQYARGGACSVALARPPTGPSPRPPPPSPCRSTTPGACPPPGPPRTPHRWVCWDQEV